MARTRTRLDEDHPCVAEGCGAPWRITEQAIYVAEIAEPVKWVPVQGECSLGIRAHSVDGYNDGLEKRRKLGWS